MGDFGTTQEVDMPLHHQLSMRKAELAANEMTWEQLHMALLNLYHQRLVETQAIKDMLQSENIDLEFDICLLYTSPSPRDRTRSRMPSSA